MLMVSLWWFQRLSGSRILHRSIFVACTSQQKGRSIVFTWRDLGRSCGTKALQLVRCAATGGGQRVANAIVLWGTRELWGSPDSRGAWMYVNTFTYLFLCSTVKQSTQLGLDPVPVLQKQILRYIAQWWPQSVHPKIPNGCCVNFVLEPYIDFTEDAGMHLFFSVLLSTV